MDIRTAKAVEELLRDARRIVKDAEHGTPADAKILHHILEAIELIRQEHDRPPE